MKSTIPTFSFPVPLTSKTWVSVQKHIHPQLDTEHTQQEFRKKLALYAVDFYLQCMAFQINPEGVEPRYE
ncbi:hypothetical protein HRE53_25980 (plasmid) [Acaryochloris sp. 'Moss Beach']|uniref:hypothetical protein n=1 Tax=Acaryochloris TaxID=155977 RepID=UPI001BAFB716|nr:MULTISPECIES: hypothetical protein [Acaryochloris]QUY40369.1 hypothetical protein I1H34_00150 [Acaryochloris marina S15]UJB72383.1 hypothetical protein HRE53_25980 [Acaryochloris sp. 'Moss Beach']